MFTEPADLPPSALPEMLRERWGFTALSVEHLPVGFGSHHWLATGAGGERLFATVHDLAAKPHAARDTPDDAFGRLDQAFRTARALRDEAGLGFVVAPLPAADGQVLVRLRERYSLVIHPYVTGTVAGQDGAFTRGGDRKATVDLLIQLHRAQAGQPRVDDLVVPRFDILQDLARDPGGVWRGGPYAQPAHDLLRAHSRDLLALTGACRSLAARVATRPERMVITHGEPHSGNIIVTAEGLALIDWDTVLVAPPERDLWDLVGDDPALADYYTAATGTPIDGGALSLYRLWFDLSEVSEYLGLFQAPHGDSADTQESWRNLQHYLRPAERWPSLT